MDRTFRPNYWGQSTEGQYNFGSSDFGQPNQQFEFQTYDDQQSADYSSYTQKSYLDPTQSPFSDDLYRQDNFAKGSTGFVDEEEEPPLLEELGIDPDRILQKTLAVLNPFHRRGQIDDANYLLQDSDLAGPIAFCLTFAAFLLAGSKAYFGYVYGLAVMSCIFMYILLSLMSNSGNITLSSVASILGYCLLPVVILAGFSIFTTLRGPIGLVSSMFAVAWSTLSAAKLFTIMSGEENQYLLIAYPCALLYVVTKIEPSNQISSNKDEFDFTVLREQIHNIINETFECSEINNSNEDRDRVIDLRTRNAF